jgi:hypothetical protein
VGQAWLGGLGSRFIKKHPGSYQFIGFGFQRSRMFQPPFGFCAKSLDVKQPVCKRQFLAVDVPLILSRD